MDHLFELNFIDVMLLFCRELVDSLLLQESQCGRRWGRRKCGFV